MPLGVPVPGATERESVGRAVAVALPLPQPEMLAQGEGEAQRLGGLVAEGQLETEAEM